MTIDVKSVIIGAIVGVTIMYTSAASGVIKDYRKKEAIEKIENLEKKEEA